MISAQLTPTRIHVVGSTDARRPSELAAQIADQLAKQGHNARVRVNRKSLVASVVVGETAFVVLQCDPAYLNRLRTLELLQSDRPRIK